MKLLLNIKETAAFSGLGEKKIYRLIHEDSTFPSVKVGQYYKINAVLLQDWINRRTEEGGAI